MSDPLQREDSRERTRRDLERLHRRGPASAFWRSLALLGSVGWPIVLLAIGGAWIGRWIDERFGTGVNATVIALGAGAACGTWIAFHNVRRDAS